MKQESIDNAFLFLLTSLTLLFGVLNDTVGGPRAVFLQVPLIISGFFVPFYIGYIRGLIDPRSNPERVRGWIYFVFGVATYAWIFSEVTIVDFLNQPGWASITIVVALIGYILATRAALWAKKMIGVSDSIGLSCLEAVFESAAVYLTAYFIYSSWIQHIFGSFAFLAAMGVSGVTILNYALIAKANSTKRQSRAIS